MLPEFISYTFYYAIIFFAFYKWTTANDEYFTKRKLKHLKPRIFGNAIGLILNRYKSAEYIDSIYRYFPGEKLVGFFDWRNPVYLVRDIEVLRRIAIKDFDDFEDHVEFIENDSDVIASCAFGVEINSFNDPGNDFYAIVKNNTNFNEVSSGLKLLLIRTLPKLMRLLTFEFFSTHVKRFFKSMVLQEMDFREKEQIFRPDMIDTLMQMRNGILKYDHEDNTDSDGFATAEEPRNTQLNTNRMCTDDEIVTQCFQFFVAGFGTSSTLMTFMSYELASNQDIQQKLYEEILEANAKLNCARVSYGTISKLKYLDQVVSETLRKWPPAIFTNRKCTKSHVFNLDGNQIMIERDRAICIPIYSIHHDPNYYENPEKFNPERFSDENKCDIKMGTYIPFGIGQRNCIGSRFALMKIKAMFYCLLLKFSIETNESTQIPIKSGSSAVKRGISLDFKLRQ